MLPPLLAALIDFMYGINEAIVAPVAVFVAGSVVIAIPEVDIKAAKVVTLAHLSAAP